MTVNLQKRLLTIAKTIDNDLKDCNEIIAEKYGDNFLTEFKSFCKKHRADIEEVNEFYKCFRELYDEITDLRSKEYILIILYRLYIIPEEITEEHIWNVLNKNIYNIKDKFYSYVILFNLLDARFNVDVRVLNGKERKNYKLQYTCSMKEHHKLLFRVYYNPVLNSIKIKVFNREFLPYEFREKYRKKININTEEELDSFFTELLGFM